MWSYRETALRAVGAGFASIASCRAGRETQAGGGKTRTRRGHLAVVFSCPVCVQCLRRPQDTDAGPSLVLCARGGGWGGRAGAIQDRGPGLGVGPGDPAWRRAPAPGATRKATGGSCGRWVSIRAWQFLQLREEMWILWGGGPLQPGAWARGGSSGQALVTWPGSAAHGCRPGRPAGAHTLLPPLDAPRVISGACWRLDPSGQTGAWPPPTGASLPGHPGPACPG